MHRGKVWAAALAIATSAFLSGQQGYPPPPAGYPPPPPQSQDPQAAPDQPGQSVARLGVINGDASVRRGDSGEWVAAVPNAPLMAGDSISVAPGGSAEMQLDYGNFVRIAGDSEIRISALGYGQNQIQIAKGLITWRVLRDSNVQSEISTPEVAVHPLRQSEVRIEVASDGGSRIIVRRGEVDASTSRGSERVREGNMMLVRASSDGPEYQIVYAAARDSWDNWNDQRDNYLLRSQSNQYVSQDINGAEDLDPYGRWGYDPAYGNVWTPNVPANWAPYSYGQWVWEPYYGWTWVDYDPWGWAPFHYGWWYFRTGFGWSWYPGFRSAHYWWHPAMVGFFGFGGVGVGFGFANVGWVPLAPFELFRPWYGPGWYGGGAFAAGRFNVENVNVYNAFRNARIASGINAVSAVDFQRGVFANRVAVNGAELQRASLARGALPVTPTASNLRFTNRLASGAGPRMEIGNQRFFSRMSVSNPAGQRTSFAQEQSAIRSGLNAESRARAQYGGSRPAATAWRRFGEPPTQQNGVQSGFAQPQRSSAGGGSWNRFGSPQASPQREPSYRGGEYRSAPAPRNNRGGQRGGSRSSGSRR